MFSVDYPYAPNAKGRAFLDRLSLAAGRHGEAVPWQCRRAAEAEGGMTRYPSNTASAPFTASALSVTVFSSEAACTVMFSAKNRASVT